jgi:hypothetical protein
MGAPLCRRISSAPHHHVHMCPPNQVWSPPETFDGCPAKPWTDTQRNGSGHSLQWAAPSQPSCLWNSMVNPIVGFGIRAVLWNQVHCRSRSRYVTHCRTRARACLLFNLCLFGASDSNSLPCQMVETVAHSPYVYDFGMYHRVKPIWETHSSECLASRLSDSPNSVI